MPGVWTRWLESTNYTGRVVFSIEAASPGTSQSQLETVRQNSNASTCTEYICTRRKRTPKNMHDQTKNSQRKKPKEMHATAAGFSKQLGLHLSHPLPPTPRPTEKGRPTCTWILQISNQFVSGPDKTYAESTVLSNQKTRPATNTC